MTVALSLVPHPLREQVVFGSERHRVHVAQGDARELQAEPQGVGR